MNLFDDLNEDNYIMFATKYYDNPQCTTVEEFNEYPFSWLTVPVTR